MTTHGDVAQLVQRIRRYQDVTWVPSGSPGNFMYLVTLPDGQRAMAKLTQAYGLPAHEALAEAELAPKLYTEHCR